MNDKTVDWDYAPGYFRNWQNLLVFGSVAMAGKAFLAMACSQVRIHNEEPLLEAIFHRPLGKPLITVLNHASTVDDPLIWAAVLPFWQTLLHLPRARWSLGAEELTFTNPLTSWFFGNGRVIGIRRGEGIWQRGMNVAVDLLRKGHWISIFPEGRVAANSAQLERLRWGIGRLIMESNPKPLIVPIIHRGFELLKPVDTNGFNLGHSIDIWCGPVIDMSLHYDRIVEGALDDAERRTRIALFIRDLLLQQQQAARA